MAATIATLSREVYTAVARQVGPSVDAVTFP